MFCTCINKDDNYAVNSIQSQIRNLGCYNLVHFRQVQQMEWRGQEDVEPLQGAKDKGLAQALKAQDSTFYF